MVLRIIGLPPSVARPLGAVVGQLGARAYLAPIRSLSRGLRIISIADNVLETAAPARSLEHPPQPQPRWPEIAEPPNLAAPPSLPPPAPPPVSAPGPEPAPVPATEVPPPPSPPAASSPQSNGSVAPEPSLPSRSAGSSPGPAETAATEPPTNPTLMRPIKQPNAATAEFQPAALRKIHRPVQPPGPAEPRAPGEPPVLAEASGPDEAPVVRRRLPGLKLTGPQPPRPIKDEVAGHPAGMPFEDVEPPTAGEHWTVAMRIHDRRPDRAVGEGPATDLMEPEPVVDVPVAEPESPDGPATVDGVAQRPMPAPGEDDGPYPSFW
ncbi:hypothetical protein [Dactylosporangium darangshiense]|uniref:hypothetical protein n=1 Tax=Dactylosporangium darangshiense TaxID=579108 RepID=UPI003635816C